MISSGTDPCGDGFLKRSAIALVRAIFSTTVIAAVAVLVFAIQGGSHQLFEIEQIVYQNSALFGGIFLSLLLRNYYFFRSKK